MVTRNENNVRYDRDIYYLLLTKVLIYLINEYYFVTSEDSLGDSFLLKSSIAKIIT